MNDDGQKVTGESMDKKLRILILEDVPTDAELMERELRKGGIKFSSKRVDTRKAFLKELRDFEPDLILGDYKLPSFDGLSALGIVQEKCPDVPFIFISGTIGEDLAIETLKRGATDYVLKDRLSRLAPAVNRALREVEERTERKQVEVALKESEKRFRTIFEGATDGILLADIETKKFYTANKIICEMLGYSLKEIENLGVVDIHPKEALSFVMEQFDKLVRGEITKTAELPVKRKDGSVFYAEISSVLLKVDAGTYLMGTFRDITERKRTEVVLQESEERYRRIVDNSLMGIGISRGNKVVFANPALLRMFGYDDLKEFSKIPLLNHVAPASHELIAARMEKVAQGQPVPAEFEYDILCKDGRIKTLLASSQHFTLGGATYTQTTFQDITERKRTEETLRESEERFRNLVETMKVGLASIDEKGVLTYVNEHSCNMIGYSMDEMIGRPTVDFYYDEEGRKAQEEIFAKRRKGMRDATPYEVAWRTKDGRKVYSILSPTPIFDAEGRYTGSFAIHTEITERKRAEEESEVLREQLRQSQKMEAIGRLAGGIAHDFNNLLTIIKGYSQLSLIELKEDSPLKGNIEQIHRATDRAADLVRQLLAFSRRQILEMKVLDLNTTLANLHNMLRRLIGEDIELITVLAEDLGRVKTDLGWIEQAIMNLVVNAKDAMPKGGKLIIETANVELDEAYARAHVAVTSGRYVMIAVSDTGAGMTPEVRERLFEPFFSTKEKDKGTGLGLSTVYGIVKQSGGNIWVYSEPGEGSTFKVYLPRVYEPLEEQREKVLGDELLRGSETILLVEDEENVRKLALRVLERQGYKVLAARDGEDALLVCEQFKDPIHLMLTDVVMPGMSGHELAKRLKSLHPKMKVLYMSGYTDNAIVLHGVLVEGVNYIQKPFTVDALTKKVREVLEQ
jgi:PAS domain S-box-containing protein